MNKQVERLKLAEDYHLLELLESPLLRKSTLKPTI
jgi:hypothetical protein